MKNLIWIVVAAVIAGGGYMLYSGASPKELISDAADAVNAPAALEAASDAVGAATETAEGAVSGAVEAASAAADAVADTAAAATEAAAEAAAAATQAAADAATSSSESECWSNDEWHCADLFSDLMRFSHCVCHS